MALASCKGIKEKILSQISLKEIAPNSQMELHWDGTKIGDKIRQFYSYLFACLVRLLKALVLLMEQNNRHDAPQARPESLVVGSQYRFTVLTERLIRYEWAEDGQYEDLASTFAINRKFPVPAFELVDSEASLEIITEHFHLHYNKARFSTQGFEVDIKAKTSEWGSSWRYGLATGSNLGGTARTLDHVDGRCELSEGPLARHGFASIDDSGSMIFQDNFVAVRKPGDRIDGYLFCYGLKYREAIRDFHLLSGKQPKLPRWALGNWWSRYHAYSQEEYISLMDKFSLRNIPLSVAVVDMDWHIVKGAPHAGWTGYTWNPALFPDPEAFGRELHDRNLMISLNDHPHAGIHHHEDSYEAVAKAVDHDTKTLRPIPFDCTSREYMGAYLNIILPSVEKVACDFWWLDWQQGKYSSVKGIDPLWVLNHFVFHHSGRTAENRTPIIFSRYAGPGSQRYPVGFSGDSVTSWASLQFQPEFTATASNVGFGWWSHDIGGHHEGIRDDELLTRWVQFGVFSPIMRLHSTNSQWNSKEPWLYKSKDIIENYLRFRHRLVPYIYTMNVRSFVDDNPLVQPLYWSFPRRDEAYQFPNQYYFGADLIVSPVVTPRNRHTNLGSSKVWLPPVGHLVDIFTGTVYDGDRTILVYRSMEDIPVFAPAGSIVTLDANLSPGNGCSPPTAFEILVVVGRDVQREILESSSSKNPNPKSREDTDFVVGNFKFTQKTGRLVARVEGRSWSFRFLAIKENLTDLKMYIDGKLTSEVEAVVEKYPKTPSLLVRCPQMADGSHTIVIELGANPQLAVLDHKSRMYDIIWSYETSLANKDALWHAVDTTRLANARISGLLSLGLDVAFIGPLLEVLLADHRIN